MNRDQLFGQLEALLSRTVDRGCTESEAEEAMLAVHRLLLKYNLDLSEVRDRKQESGVMRLEIPCGLRAGSYSQWLPDILSCVSILCGVVGFWSDAADPPTIMLVGFEVDIEAAITLYDYLSKTALAIYEHGLRRIDNPVAFGFITSMDPEAFRTSFLNGFAFRLVQRAQAEKTKLETQANGETAIVVFQDERRTAIERAIEASGCKREHIRAGSTQHSTKGFTVGMDSAEVVALHPSKALDA